MKLFKVSQKTNMDYDTYDSMVVCAESEEEARKIHPDEEYLPKDAINWNKKYSTWCRRPEDAEVEYLGEAKDDIKKGIIITSFNAG